MSPPEGEVPVALDQPGAAAVPPVIAPPQEPRPAGVPAWRFWLPMLVQLAIVAAVPAPKVYAHVTGVTVRLQVAPVDPYDVLRGRYVRLGYAAAQPDTLKQVPGGAATHASDTPVWVELAPAARADQPWKPVRVTAEAPTGLPAGHVAIRGKVTGGDLDFGLGEFFVDEFQGDDLQAALRADAAKGLALAEVRVARDGTAVLEHLWVGGRAF